MGTITCKLVILANDKWPSYRDMLIHVAYLYFTILCRLHYSSSCNRKWHVLHARHTKITCQSARYSKLQFGYAIPNTLTHCRFTEPTELECRLPYLRMSPETVAIWDSQQTCFRCPVFIKMANCYYYYYYYYYYYC